MDTIFENGFIWLVEAVVIIFASFLIGLIIGRGIKCVNGDDDVNT